MSSSFYVALFVCAVAVAVILFVSYKTGHFVKSVLLSALSGIGALFAVNILAEITAVSIPVNYITLAASGVLGIPGVIALLFMS